MTDKK